LIVSPTPFEPVNAIIDTSGWFTSVGPISSPMPGRKLSTLLALKPSELPKFEKEFQEYLRKLRVAK
jgi:hypothetical protein